VNYRDTEEEAAFRASARAWFAAHVPQGWRDIHEPAAWRAFTRSWHQTLYAAGYVGMSWPVEHGGQGRSAIFDAILGAEAARADAPPLPAKINYLGRAVWTYGSDAQKQRFLPPLLNGDHIWCQGFSEPEAGSDLASLRARGVRAGDGWVVDGQKMWTSGAEVADWCFLLVRTDPDAPAHKGISALLTAMDTPGIEVRPIRLANGDPETAEVFFDGVHIPADQMLGEQGQGWAIAMTTLAYERGPGDAAAVPKIEAALHRLEAEARARGALRDERVRDELTRAYVRIEALRLAVIEQLSLRVAGKGPGEEGSIAKMLWIDAEQSLHQLAVDVVGPDVWLGRDARWLSDYLWSRAASVYGGTVQIQKNVIAQRLLGMPRR
jgi:alkylation response protein AidB-like acyl-CoA dehydrogenase